MATKQYIGARYVPLFADPIDWDRSKTYEPLTIVYHQGNSYTSRQSVPAGVDITDTTYWALTGNYNAQIEQYRKETASKLSTVTTDGTLKGNGTKTEPLKVALNHSTVISDTGKTVYPTLMHKQGDSSTILGIGFNVGDGLTPYNTGGEDVGSGLRLANEIKTSIENSEQSLTALGAGTPENATQFKNKVQANSAAIQALDSKTSKTVDSALASHMIVHAHRGSYRFPENTMEGIMWAVRHGYVPEIDVQLTSDGVPVILHDTSTARTMTGTAANVSSITYADFMSREVKAKVHGGNTGKPVSMEQVLQAVGDSPVDFEIKSLNNATTDAMLELLRKYNATAIHELTSFSWEQCVRAVQGGVKYVSYTWDVDAMPHSWTDMHNAGIFCGNPREDKLTSSMVSAAHSAGVKINPWLINDPVAYERVAALGVDGITSNWPDYASGQLERNFTPFSTGQNVFMRPNYAPQGGAVSQEISEEVRAKSSYLAPDGLFQLGDADSQMLVELVECGTVTLPVSIDLEGFESRIQIGENGGTKNIAVIAVKESTPIGQFNDVATAGQVGIIAGVRRNGATFGGFYQDNVTTVAFDNTDPVAPSVPNDKAVGVHASFVLDRDHARIIWAYSNGQAGDVTTGNNKNVTLPDTDKYRLFVRLNRNFKSAWKIRVRPTDGFLYES
jgi:glycerophosphoryl diester phosphodiesterase